MEPLKKAMPMHVLRQAIRDWNVLALCLHKFKSIEGVIDSAFETSNFDGGAVDVSYKSICVTVFECNGYIALSTKIECGEGDEFYNINLMEYSHPVRLLGAYREG